MASTVTASPDDLRYRDRPPGTHTPSALRRFFGVVAEPDSYRNLAYLLLGLPLGVVWFTALVTAVATAASMVVVALVAGGKPASSCCASPPASPRSPRP